VAPARQARELEAREELEARDELEADDPRVDNQAGGRGAGVF
jgi:hypothetical protein